MQNQMNQMKQQMEEASKLKGLFESIISDGKLVQHSNTNGMNANIDSKNRLDSANMTYD